MSALTDIQIRAWIKSGERFEQRGDGGGLFLSYRENFAMPIWRFRYRFAGQRRVMTLGSYADLSLAEARRQAKEYRARVALGYDVAGEKQERKAEALEKIEAAKNAYTVGQLAEEYFEKTILGRWKHPNIVRSRIEKDIKPNIGKIPVEDVKPMDISNMLETVVERGAPTVANDVLRWTKRMFDYAIKRHIIQFNPASAFDLSDAGGKEDPRTRALSRDELVILFEGMRKTKGFSLLNEYAFKLLLMLCVRKGELVTARVDQFDLDKATWQLTTSDTKTKAEIIIPLPKQAVELLRDIIRLSDGVYLFPARQYQDRRLPYIHENTLNVALSKVKANMPGVDPFTIHDFRRTARTHLAALGIESHIAERCLNHKIKGVEGIYNRHDYFDERKAALQKLANFIEACEKGKDWNVTPFRKANNG
ncbi:tyrosine-type recombinase/integrase [Methylomonas methanica]|uniref:Integrase family protein n=1 Tax=Methylomonas methanica (strain DSM 25384 / MC09) TaxID=857087 RepID=G0A3U4_METMM|nr:site-specific integrase [Methylomonas methanica]AEG02716.1 integrase family protein [Methylomonas methanica MC09]